jgi:hypothetical protein
MIAFQINKKKGTHAGRLERSALQWHGKDIIMGGSVLYSADDIRKLYFVQLVSRYSGRRIFDRGKIYWPKMTKMIFFKMHIELTTILHRVQLISQDFDFLIIFQNK